MKYDIKNNTLEECQEYWENEAEKGHNKSENYNRIHTQQRSKYLLGLLKKYSIKENSSILELGCNCCRNLNHLFSNNYKNLTGIDISKKALSTKEKFFPELKANLINSSIEDHILKFHDNEFDLVFSMAVLQHVSLDSNWIFEHIARIAKEYIIFIELDLYRNYENLISKFGFSLIERRNCTQIKGLEKYKANIFKRIK
jgi:SAM-dependent methyltransferase